MGSETNSKAALDMVREAVEKAYGVSVVSVLHSADDQEITITFTPKPKSRGQVVAEEKIHLQSDGGGFSVFGERLYLSAQMVKAMQSRLAHLIDTERADARREGIKEVENWLYRIGEHVASSQIHNEFICGAEKAVQP